VVAQRSQGGFVMRPISDGSRVVVASHNAGKIAEFVDLLAPLGLSVVSAADLGLDEPEETEATFAGNAKIKAVAAAKASGLPALADDSGLEVAALDGAPGVYSARWAGPEKDFGRAMRRVYEAVVERDGWRDDGPVADFACVLCLAWPDGETMFFEGKVMGRLVYPPRGDMGFGYDPMFRPDAHDRTFGEMAASEKHAMSHRARAFEKLANALQLAQKS
jgi:XTP/dITP diphosphohydrolase